MSSRGGVAVAVLSTFHLCHTDDGALQAGVCALLKHAMRHDQAFDLVGLLASCCHSSCPLEYCSCAQLPCCAAAAGSDFMLWLCDVPPGALLMLLSMSRQSHMTTCFLGVGAASCMPAETDWTRVQLFVLGFRAVYVFPGLYLIWCYSLQCGPAAETAVHSSVAFQVWKARTQATLV